MLALNNDEFFIPEENQTNENELSKELSPIEMLTDDLRGVITFHCDLPTMNTLLRLSKKWNKVTDHPAFWKKVADILNIPFYKAIKENCNYYVKTNKENLNKNSLSVKIRVNLNSALEFLNKNENPVKIDIKNCIKLIGKQSLIEIEREKALSPIFRHLKFNATMQDDIDKLLNSVKYEDIQTLQEFGQAIDTYLFWEAIAKHPSIDLTITCKTENCLSVKEFICMFKKFNNWCQNTANKLLEITHLDLKVLLKDKRMNSLPSEIWQFLPNLETLRVTGNGITFLPEEIGLFCPKLKNIDLSSNWLMSLTESFSNLKNLETLNISGNWFKQLPKCIFKLKELKTLNISSNRISSLPEEMSNLENLETLDISWNLIDTLDNITDLKKLKKLNASQNAISSIRNCKNEILEMENLNELDLKGNAIWISVPDKFWTSNLANNTQGIRKHVVTYDDLKNYSKFSLATGPEFLSIANLCFIVMGIAIAIFNTFTDYK